MKLESLIIFCDEPFIYDIRFCLRPIKVWHGDFSLAMISNNAGIYDKRYRIQNMFDKSKSTFWHSDTNRSKKVKTITVDFFVSLNHDILLYGK